MLLQGMDRMFLFLGGEMRVDIHGHGRIGMTEEILRRFHIHPGVIEHGRVSLFFDSIVKNSFIFILLTYNLVKYVKND